MSARSHPAAWPLLAVLIVIVLAAYRPAWHGGLVWDDDRHMTSVDLQSMDGLRRIWSELGATQQYYPVAHSAFWIQHRLWGNDTLGYHVVNAVLHALSAWLVLLILRRLKVPGAVLAAGIFAVHPVHVESVAWISELKNTLSGVLYLAAACVYLDFDEHGRKRAYAVASVLFILAVLSKTVTATLPAALLVVFWWQRGRIRRRDVLPLVPWFALGIGAGALTAWVERTVIGAQGSEFQIGWLERCLIAGRAIWFYVGKLIWPTQLSFNYPRWTVQSDAWWQYLFPLGVIIVIALSWVVRRQSRAPLAVTLLFCSTLFPVLGFLNVFPFQFSFVADHFQYLASIAIIGSIASGLVLLARRLKWRDAPTVTGLFLIICLPLARLTWRQSADYANAETLYRATLRRNPSSWMALTNLGMLRFESAIDEAASLFEQALRVKPDVAEAHNNLGYALQRQGRLEEAIRRHEEAVRLKPDLAQAHYNLCVAYRQLDRLERAEAECLEALRLNSGSAETHYQLGLLRYRQERLAEAAARLTEATRLAPGEALPYNDLGSTLRRLGRLDEAMGHYATAVRLKPDFADAWFNLGNTLQALGRHADAIPQYAQALKYRPNDAVAHNNLGVALESVGRLDEALAQYQEALRLRPDFPEARQGLARVGVMKRPVSPASSSISPPPAPGSPRPTRRVPARRARTSPAPPP